jgi:hypothetical protein
MLRRIYGTKEEGETGGHTNIRSKVILKFYSSIDISVVRVSGYRSRGPEFDSRRTRFSEK